MKFSLSTHKIEAQVHLYPIFTVRDKTSIFPAKSPFLYRTVTIWLTTVYLLANFYRTVIFMANQMKGQAEYGVIRSAEELGKLARAHRRQRKLTLETISGLGNVSTRFLSEFERGKETAELGKVLKALRTLGLEVIIQPRGGASHASSLKQKEDKNA
ncbi:helix-turn-helix domain-containing protein [Cellvibrio sp. ARAG 10.3]|uniref:helix-turn-helix domain-containing protein n=1 Tax=Cellvibrio sp. ARAG 10.3 TaxID=3451358 RepID=UPI003F47FBFF